MKGFDNMKKGISPMVTSIATAALVGTAAYMISNNTSSKKTVNSLKKNTGKALKTVGTIMENASYMMK